MHMTAAESPGPTSTAFPQGLPVHSSRSESSWPCKHDRLPEWNLHTGHCALAKLLTQRWWRIGTAGSSAQWARPHARIDSSEDWSHFLFGTPSPNCTPIQLRHPQRITEAWDDQRNVRESLWAVEGASDEVWNVTSLQVSTKRMNDFSIQITFLINAWITLTKWVLVSAPLQASNSYYKKALYCHYKKDLIILT